MLHELFAQMLFLEFGSRQREMVDIPVAGHAVCLVSLPQVFRHAGIGIDEGFHPRAIRLYITCLMARVFTLLFRGQQRYP